MEHTPSSFTKKTNTPTDSKKSPWGRSGFLFFRENGVPFQSFRPVGTFEFFVTRLGNLKEGLGRSGPHNRPLQSDCTIIALHPFRTT